MQADTHTGWLSTNCNNQADYYASYLQQHNLPGGQAPSQQQKQQQQSSSNGSGSTAAPSATAASDSNRWRCQGRAAGL
jgi:hypothetical protein